MKKEKTIRSYKRKTKSGKVVTVKQHTAKYDAAEEMKKALAKKGAGEELASKKLTADELKQVKSIVEENSELDEQYVAAFYPELSPRMVKAVMAEYRKKSATPKAKAANTAGKTPKAKAEKSSAPDLGFTADEYKAWYHWDTENDPKNKAAMKVKKALLGAMGPRAYKKYEEDMTNSYSSRGHSKAYGTLPELVQARSDARNASLMEKTHKAQASVAKLMGAKEAEASFTSRAKEQGAKRKEAKKKIGELSPSAKGTLTKKDMESLETPIKDIRACAKALGITEREAASWMEGPNFAGFKESHLKKGNAAAKKFLGAKVYSQLDPNEADVPMAVIAKLGRKGYGGGAYMRAKEQVEKRKAATAKIASLSPKDTGGLKIGATVKMPEAIDGSRGKAQPVKVLAVQKANKSDAESGATHIAWVQHKDGAITLAFKHGDKWATDSTWSDLGDFSKRHPYAKALKGTGYHIVRKSVDYGQHYWGINKDAHIGADRGDGLGPVVFSSRGRAVPTRPKKK